MANTVLASQSTTSRELARNTDGKGCRYKQALEKAAQRCSEAAKPSKMTPKMISDIKQNIADRVESKADIGLATRSKRAAD